MREGVDTSSYIIQEGDGDKAKHKVIPAQLAQYIRQHLEYIFVRSNPTAATLIYVYQNGVYRHVSVEEFKGEIKEYIPERLQKPRDINDAYSLLTTDAEKYVHPNRLNEDENLINFQNGILYLDEMRLAPHTSLTLSTIQIPCNWIQDAISIDDSVFDSYLDQLTDGDLDTKKLILEYMGAVLSNIPGHRAKKALLLIGPGNSGKSQLRNLLIELIGQENSSSCSLDDLEKQFGASTLYGKRLGGDGDLGFVKVNELRIFKQLTGGDSIKCEFKGHGAFPYVYKGWMLFCANARPLFGGDKGDHVYQRFMIIPCNNVIPDNQIDPQILDKMRTEREYIVQQAVRALKRFIDRGCKFIEPQCVKQEREDYEIENDNVLLFIQECTEQQEPCETYGRTRTADMYNAYAQWCKGNGLRPENSRIFRKTLKDKKRASTVKNCGYEFYANIRLTAEAHNDLYSTRQGGQHVRS